MEKTDSYDGVVETVCRELRPDNQLLVYLLPFLYIALQVRGLRWMMTFACHPRCYSRGILIFSLPMFYVG